MLLECRDGGAREPGLDRHPMAKTDLSVHLVHDDNKDKDFELEMTWICEESKWKHAAVPADLLKEADDKGRAALEECMEED